MIILIDGYNVLKEKVGLEVGQTDRYAFIALLGAYAKQKGHTIKLLFDGGPYGMPERYTDKGIEIMYVGAERTADEQIIQFVMHQLSKEIVVVSSDRHLTNTVEKFHATVVPSNVFYELVFDATINIPTRALMTDQIKRYRTDGSSEIDQLMSTASENIVAKSVDMYAQIDKAQARRISPNRTASKKAKRVKKILKKL